MVLLCVIQIFFRYGLNLSLAWTEELIRVCFIWFTLVGAPLALMQRGDHMKVEYFVARLPKKWFGRVNIGADVLVLCFSVILLVYGIQLTAIMADQVFTTFKVSMAYSGLAIPAGSLFFIIGVLYHLWSRIRRTEKAGEH